jgi:cyclopropane fatty-acyl-phospholipid synthase-like methyltransferase
MLRVVQERQAGMKRMKLYDHVERVHTELRAAGKDDGEPLTVADLTPFDQFHYLGTEAVDHAIAVLAPTAHWRVLDVGAGIGGPARYLAAATGCHVTAVELQADLDATAAALTRRCGLDDRVHHRCGDVLEGVAERASFDAVVSFLAILHIPDRARLFAVLHDALRPGGRLYVEDFARRGEPTPAQWEALRVKVQCPGLPTPSEYRADVAGAGFEDIEIEDLSEPWTAFTRERLSAFRADRERNLAIHGPHVVDGLDDFYATVAGLYADGALGGVRVIARRR